MASSPTLPNSNSASSAGGLPLPNVGGTRVHQKHQKYPERELKITIEDDFCYNNNVINAPVLIRLGEARLHFLNSVTQQNLLWAFIRAFPQRFIRFGKQLKINTKPLNELMT